MNLYDGNVETDASIQFFSGRDDAIKAGIGSVMLWAGSSKEIPGGFLLCNGQELSPRQYFKLYSVIGTTYGAGKEGNAFNVPNLQHRTAVGSDPNDKRYSLGSEIGSEKQASAARIDLPGQQHHTTFSPNLENPWPVNHVPGGSYTVDVTIDTIPPSLAMNYIIKFQ